MNKSNIVYYVLCVNYQFNRSVYRHMQFSTAYMNVVEACRIIKINRHNITRRLIVFSVVNFS